MLVLESILAIFQWLPQKAGEFFFFIGIGYFAIGLFKKRKWIYAVLLLLVGVSWVLGHKPVTKWVARLGGDSFIEARNYDFDEAVFWLRSTKTIVTGHYRTHPKRLARAFARMLGYILVAYLFLWLIRRLARKLNFTVTPSVKSTQNLQWGSGFALVFILISVTHAIWPSVVGLMQSSDVFNTLADNFDTPSPDISIGNRRLNVVVYIGEATSTMNMQLYGYTRDTTPNLSKLHATDPNLLVFSNVFSTHTHTTQSLLEALSVGVDASENFLPITNRKRLSIADIFIKSGIEVTVYSGQGSTGSWNRAASIVFKNAKRFFSADTAGIGNLGDSLDYAPRPWDHDFFDGKAKNLFTEKPSESGQVVFLHSYAGHGPYLGNIPARFHTPVDGSLSGRDMRAILGDNFNDIESIEEYDAAIRYIDFAVTQQIQQVQDLNVPVIFIYFADHGDAVYSMRGHDSSRFINEMSRVPFVVYFNQTARNLYPGLYKKYLNLSMEDKTATLAELPGMLLDLFAAQITIDSASDAFSPPPGLGDEIKHFPIVVRQYPNGDVSYVNIYGKPFDTSYESNDDFIDITDPVTQHFVAAAMLKRAGEHTTLCYHRANTLGKARRGSLVVDCLEVDVVVEGNGEVAVYHPPAENVGFTLDEVFALAKQNDLSLWLDSKNLQNVQACLGLHKFLAASAPVVEQLLIEFPPHSIWFSEKLAPCAQKLRQLGYYTSYYVPTSKATKCAEAILAGEQFRVVPSCKQVETDIVQAIDSGLFTDISFDYRGIKAIEAIALAKQLKWNTWGVAPKQVTEVNPSRFRMIIAKNSDPNNS